MRISLDEVRETALLARLDLQPAELERLQGEHDAILGYMETLSKLDVTGVEPTTHAVPMDAPHNPATIRPMKNQLKEGAKASKT